MSRTKIARGKLDRFHVGVRDTVSMDITINVILVDKGYWFESLIGGSKYDIGKR